MPPASKLLRMRRKGNSAPASIHELPRRLILGNSDSYTRIPVRYRGVGMRACSPGFLEEFFSETELPALPSRDLLLGKGRSLLSSTLPTLVVRDPPADTPPLMPYRRFANASPGPAE